MFPLPKLDINSIDDGFLTTEIHDKTLPSISYRVGERVHMIDDAENEYVITKIEKRVNARKQYYLASADGNVKAVTVEKLVKINHE